MACQPSRLLASAPGEQSNRRRKQPATATSPGSAAAAARSCQQQLSFRSTEQTAAQVWLMGPGLEHLASNNSARAQIWILEALPPLAPARRWNLANNNALWPGCGFCRMKGSALLADDRTDQRPPSAVLVRTLTLIRKIERHLRMVGRHTIRNYLDAPAQGPATRPLYQQTRCV